MIIYDKNSDFQKKYLPYYGIGLFSTAMHEVGHATAGTILGVKIKKIQLEPWMTGSCHFTTYPECLRMRAAISLAGPIVGTATTIACIKWHNHNKETNSTQKILCGFLLAKQISNLVPGNGYDGHDCWWYLKSKFYKGINEDLLKPKYGMVKTQFLHLCIAYACMSFFNKDIFFEQMDCIKNIMNNK